MDLYTRIKPTRNGRLTLKNGLGGTEFLVDRETLCRLLLKKNLPTEAQRAIESSNFYKKRIEIDLRSLSTAKHWINKNWLHSLYFYVDSLIDHCADTGDDYQIKQHNVVMDYLRKDGSPAKIKILENKENTKYLGQGAFLPQMPLAQLLKKRACVRATPKRSVLSEVLASVLYNGSRFLVPNRLLSVENSPRCAVESFGVAFDIYVIAYDVTGLETGVYFYDPVSERIEIIKRFNEEILREKMYNAQTEQVAAKTAAYAIAIVSHHERYQWRYRHSAAFQHIFINAGQVMQSFLLCATRFDHRTHISPAIGESKMCKILDLEEQLFQPLYILSAA